MRVLLLGVTLFLVVGCASKTTVILLPGEGDSGGITLSTHKNSVDIDTPGQAVSLSKSKGVGKTQNMGQEEIQQLFGSAVEFLPDAPLHFKLYFVSDSTQLTKESEALLKSLVQEVRSRKSTDISVVGHTDRAGDSSFNELLARNRAEFVSTLLVELGMESKFMQVTSHGENNPLVPTEDGMHEPKNRRVEVVVR